MSRIETLISYGKAVLTTHLSTPSPYNECSDLANKIYGMISKNNIIRNYGIYSDGN